MLWAALLLFSLWCVYQVAFDAPFYFDSRSHLVTNTHLHMVEVSPQSLSDAVRLGHGGKVYRPLSNLTLAFTHLASGLEPRAFRLGNLLIHWLGALAVLFLFFSVRATPAMSDGDGGRPRLGAWTALLAATLWALHPVQTNVVTYVIQRMASLSGLFTFLAVACYLRARSAACGWSWRYGSLAALGLVLAVASKENAVVAVLLCGAAEWVLLRPPESPGVRRGALGAALLGGAGAAGLAAWKAPALWKYLAAVAETRSFSPWERLLTQAGVQVQYLTLLLTSDPRLLTLDAQVEVSRGLLRPPSTAAAVAVVVLCLALAVAARRRAPLLSFGILWFFGAQAVESTVIPLELYYEHRVYVPSAFLFLGVACGVGAAVSSRRRALRITGMAAVPVLLAGYGMATYYRNVQWSEPIAFWADAVAKSPTNPRPRVNFCSALVEAGLYEPAREVCSAALELGADPIPVRMSLATAAYRTGNKGEAREQLLAALATEEDPKLQSGKWVVHRGLAVLLLEEGDLSGAREHLERATSLHENDSETWNLRGTTALLAGEAETAEAYLRRAVQIDPVNAKAWNNLGVLLFQRHDYAGAMGAFQRATHFAPEDLRYRGNVEAARKRAEASQRPPSEPAGPPAPRPDAAGL